MFDHWILLVCHLTQHFSGGSLQEKWEWETIQKINLVISPSKPSNFRQFEINQPDQQTYDASIMSYLN